ncbi:MAG: polysaccharide deacetylase family protein [Burkholderiales bacterium]|jgi:peptidoglycan/xylan/chitin deacetylase (PgdA/CDA1 family)
MNTAFAPVDGHQARTASPAASPLPSAAHLPEPNTHFAPPWRWPPALRASLGLHTVAGAAAALLPGTENWALSAVLANHLGLTAAGLWPRSALLGPNVKRLPEAAIARRQFALTVDDGPDPVVTPVVLDLLDEAGVKATFFVIARRAVKHAALLRETVRRGHDIQNHSHLHRHDFSLRGPKALAREIGTAQERLADLTGQRPHCFRAPAGLRNPMLDPVLHRLGLHLVSWTRRGFDTQDPNPARVLNRLIGRNGQGLAAGDILLLHDGNVRLTAQGRPVLLSVLAPLLAMARAAGLEAATLREALPPRCSATQSPGPALPPNPR